MKPPKLKNPITLPDGFEPPADLQDRDTFDAVAKIRRDGKSYCVVELDGMPMPGYDEEKDETAPDDEEADGETVGTRVMKKARGA